MACILTKIPVSDYEALDANHNKMKQAFSKYWGTLKDLNINKDERRNKHKCANH